MCLKRTGARNICLCWNPESLHSKPDDGWHSGGKEQTKERVQEKINPLNGCSKLEKELQPQIWMSYKKKKFYFIPPSTPQ